MESFGQFQKTGRYYTTAEKEFLKSGDFERAAEVCGNRHSRKGIYNTLRRNMDPRLTENGIPRALDRLCIKLGIRSVRTVNPENERGKKIRSRQDEIVRRLASLPNAANYDEEHWLDTPELWPFVDFERIREPYGDSGGNLRQALEARIEGWCDRWIPYSDTLFSNRRYPPDGLYIYPFEDELRAGIPVRTRKKYVMDHTWLALSQARKKEHGENIGSAVRDEVLKLAGKMSVGFISFRCGLPVADVVSIMSCEPDNIVKNQ